MTACVAKREPIFIKYRHLCILGACEQKERFKEIFGEQVLATVTTAVAHADKFDWMWIGQSILNAANWKEMERRVRTKYGDSVCHCPMCDPDHVRSKFIAQAFAEAFLAQGGWEGRRTR